MNTSRNSRVDGPSRPLVLMGADGWHDSEDPASPSLHHIVRLLEEQAQIGYWWHDAASDEISVSPGLARITGTPATVRRTRDSMLQAIHPQDRPYQDDQLRLIDLGHPVRREFRIVRPDGTIRWVSCKIDVVLGIDGRPVRFIGVLLDITERREALRAIEYNQERRIALLEALSTHTWRADASGEQLDYAVFRRITGLSEADCAGDGARRPSRGSGACARALQVRDL